MRITHVHRSDSPTPAGSHLLSAWTDWAAGLSGRPSGPLMYGPTKMILWIAEAGIPLSSLVHLHDPSMMPAEITGIVGGIGAGLDASQRDHPHLVGRFRRPVTERQGQVVARSGDRRDLLVAQPPERHHETLNERLLVVDDDRAADMLDVLLFFLGHPVQHRSTHPRLDRVGEPAFPRQRQGRQPSTHRLRRLQPCLRDSAASTRPGSEPRSRSSSWTASADRCGEV